jgi:hypothetical protein
LYLEHWYILHGGVYPWVFIHIQFRFRCRQEAKGYKDNFLIRCSTQQQSKLPVKSAKDSLTVYFTAPWQIAAWRFPLMGAANIQQTTSNNDG